MKPFASYSRRFQLNFKPKKTEFLKNVHWCCPLSIIGVKFPGEKKKKFVVNKVL